MITKYSLVILAFCTSFVYGRTLSLSEKSRFTPQEVSKAYGISMLDQCKYGPHDSFSLVNPQAPKGGSLNLSVIGPAFTSLNPFCPEQECAPRVMQFQFDPLMARSPDEPFALYGLLAQSIQCPPDRSWLIIHLDPRARFSNNLPVTAQDVVFTYDSLARYGSSGRRALAKRVESVQILDLLTVRFDFRPDEQGVYDRELPLIILLMSVISEKGFQGKPFNQTGMTPLVGSGPYFVGDVTPGKKITYVRNPNYWAKDLPVNKGRFNPDKISFEVFYHDMPAFEAFKRGLIDVWEEKDFQRWKKGYNFPAIREGKVRLQEVAHGQPVGMKCFVFNQNHSALKDLRVRQALSIVFDYDLFRPQIDRDSAFTESFFHGTPFQAPRLPSKDEEGVLSLLPAPLKNPELPPILKEVDKAKRQQQAINLLYQAGWKVKKNQLVNKQAKPLQLTILTKDYEQTRLAQTLAQCFKSLGVQTIIQQADPTQYAKRLQDRSYDIILYHWNHSMSPGIEQTLYWHSRSANQPSGKNYANICDPNVDFLCLHLTKASTWKDLIASLHALDRVLLQGYHVIPLFHQTKNYSAFWQYVKTPPFPSKSPYFPGLDSFWIEY